MSCWRYARTRNTIPAALAVYSWKSSELSYSLFPILPRDLTRYRGSFSQSGAKDDLTDAFLQLDYLLKHPDSLRPLVPEDPKTRILQQLVEDRREFVQRKVDLTNALTSSLKAYYPQVLQWFGDIDTLLFCDFVMLWLYDRERLDEQLRAYCYAADSCWISQPGNTRTAG